MADEQQTQPATGEDTNARSGQVDPAFFDAVNEYLKVTEVQTGKFGAKRASLAILFAAARFNTHVFLGNVRPVDAANERTIYLDYMGALYRRMLNEHLDSLGEERGIDVGDSELADEYRAAGVQVGRLKEQTPAADYVAAAGAVPPANE